MRTRPSGRAGQRRKLSAGWRARPVIGGARDKPQPGAGAVRNAPLALGHAATERQGAGSFWAKGGTNRHEGEGSTCTLCAAVHHWAAPGGLCLSCTRGAGAGWRSGLPRTGRLRSQRLCAREESRAEGNGGRRSGSGDGHPLPTRTTWRRHKQRAGLTCGDARPP